MVTIDSCVSCNEMVVSSDVTFDRCWLFSKFVIVVFVIDVMPRPC